MTLINNIEIDDIEYDTNKTKEAIENNVPIDDFLHVIVVISNPCLYAKRYILAKQFIKRLQNTQNIKIYIVELCYGEQKFYITKKENKAHLQLRTDSAPLWHKENMINIGIKKLLPPSWKSVAWIDADIEFESSTWPLDTLKILNGYKDVVQLFSHAVDMDKEQNTMQYFASFGYQYETGKKYFGSGLDFWHPGFAWACTRKAYEKMGGIYENSVLGSGDHNMAFAFIGNAYKSINSGVSNDYKEDVMSFQSRVKNLRLGYVPGIIKHYFHGHKKDRKYSERWQILVRHQYSPLFLNKNADGLIVPNDLCPKNLLDDIFAYFKERNEDV